ncbi:MAG: aminotransferase class I/II-fold pyridoxal phosphate-dependent enzyme [Gemmatimonadota bacterium]|nr:aminotransferase class I/II-fold pyridoxal phosphate-dependent enzyme [Gemmatimonadota bacterium]
MIKKSARFLRLPEYPLSDLSKAKRKLINRGVDIIDLGAGDANLSPPSEVIQALAEASEKTEMSRYGFQAGLSSFREGVAGWMKKRFGVDLDPYEEILPLLGSKEGIAKLPLAFMDPGEIALIPDPGYQSYLGGVTLAGGNPLLVPLVAKHEFLVPFDGFKRETLEKLRLLYMNYPNNPTTALASLDYLADSVEFCRKTGTVLVHDNAYSEIAFDGYRPASVLEVEGAKDVALEFHSFSKTYNMTGWRLGWVAGGADLISALTKVKTFMDTGSFMAVQYAGLAALGVYDEWVPKNVAIFQNRRDTAVTSFNEAGFNVTTPRATMYLWIQIPNQESSVSFAERALEEEGVVVLPGAGLGSGGEGFFRIALTVGNDLMKTAAKRLGRLIET